MDNFEKFCKDLIRWVKRHHWDSLEKDKDLILRHLKTFTGDKAILEVITEEERINKFINLYSELECWVIENCFDNPHVCNILDKIEKLRDEQR